MKKVLHKGKDRGVAEHGWLHTRFSFSFAQYYNPEMMGFGALRVLNDDTIEPLFGFPDHPHNNMEIVSIIVSGEITHKDSAGGEGVVKEGEVQVMSAGTGVVHSEYNKHSKKLLQLFQIWILPKEQNIQPRYDQKKFSAEGRGNKFQLIVSGDEKDKNALYIHQDAFIYLIDLENGKKISCDLTKKGNGIYVLLVEGDVVVENERLEKRDALGIWDTNKIEITAEENSKLILFEVPMK